MTVIKPIPQHTYSYLIFLSLLSQLHRRFNLLAVNAQHPIHSDPQPLHTFRTTFMHSLSVTIMTMHRGALRGRVLEEGKASCYSSTSRSKTQEKDKHVSHNLFLEAKEGVGVVKNVQGKC